MKKINFKSLDLNEIKQLSKEQLKKILGGLKEVTTSFGEPPCDCDNHRQCPQGYTCNNCGSNGENGQRFGYCTNEKWD